MNAEDIRYVISVLDFFEEFFDGSLSQEDIEPEYSSRCYKARKIMERFLTDLRHANGVKAYLGDKNACIN